MKTTRLKRIAAPLILMALTLIAQIAYAVPIPSTAELLGHTPTTDKSVAMFTHLLGGFFTSPLSFIGGTHTLIGNLFLIFNSAVFVIGMLWAGYGLIGGIAETANSGEVLGKRLSAVWLPIRMVTGIVGIVPVFGGFSLSQVFLVTMTTIGIGMANTMWAGAVGSLEEFTTLSPVSVMASSFGSIKFDAVAEDLFLMHVCNLAVRKHEAAMSTGGTTVNQNDVIQTNQLFSADKSTISMGSISTKNMCGSASFAKTAGRSTAAIGFRVSSVPYDSYTNMVTAGYMQAFSSLNQEVEGAAKVWFDARAKDPVGSAVVPFPQEKIDQLTKVANNTLDSTFATVIAEIKSKNGTDGSGVAKQAATRMLETGWLGAGSWFSTFAEANAALADAMKAVSYNYSGADYTDRGGLADSVRSDIAGILVSRKASTDDAKADSINAANQSSNDFSPVGAFLCRAISSACTTTGNFSIGQAIVKGAIDQSAVGSGGGGNDNGLINPIIMMKNMGDGLMVMSETIMALELYAINSKPSDKAPASPPGIVSTVGQTIVGIGDTFAPGLMKAVRAAGTALSMMAPYMLILGMLMAIYIPMIPFITWMGGVVQYAVVVCEGLVGAPIAALSHLEAEGEGLGQRTQAGYMFILNVTFRPALMIFGFFLASALLVVIGTFQATLFLSAMAGAQGNSITGFVSIIGFLSIFFVLNTTLIQSLFNMIFLLPDQVLNLVGNVGAGAQLGKDTHDKVNALFLTTGKVGQSAVGGGIGANKANIAAKEKKAEEDKKASSRGGNPNGQ